MIERGPLANWDMSGHRERILLVSLGLVLALVAFLAFQVFKPFLLTFTLAGSLTLFLAPFQRRLTHVLRGRSSVAASLMVLLVFLLLLLPVLSSLALLNQQGAAFFEWVRPRLQPEALLALLRDKLPTYLPWLADWLGRDEAAYTRFASGVLSRLAATGNGLVQTALTSVTGLLFDLTLFLMMLFFLLRDGPRLRVELSRISPLSDAQESEVFAHLEKTVKGVLQAMVLVPLVQGGVAVVGFWLFGLPHPLLWGLLVVLGALVPVVGSPLGWVPAVFYQAAFGTTFQWVGLLVWSFVLISGIDNVIKPLVLRGTAQIHPLLGFLSILGGLVTFGPTGFLVGPVILSLVLSGIRIYRLDVLGRGGRQETPRAP